MSPTIIYRNRAVVASYMQKNCIYILARASQPVIHDEPSDAQEHWAHAAPDHIRITSSLGLYQLAILCLLLFIYDVTNMVSRAPSVWLREVGTQTFY